jgi:hypothetical protein
MRFSAAARLAVCIVLQLRCGIARARCTARCYPNDCWLGAQPAGFALCPACERPPPSEAEVKIDNTTLPVLAVGAHVVASTKAQSALATALVRGYIAAPGSESGRYGILLEDASKCSTLRYVPRHAIRLWTPEEDAAVTRDLEATHINIALALLPVVLPVAILGCVVVVLLAACVAIVVVKQRRAGANCECSKRRGSDVDAPPQIWATGDRALHAEYDFEGAHSFGRRATPQELCATWARLDALRAEVLERQEARMAGEGSTARVD